MPDADLCNAAREIEAGKWDADLGGGVCKKRVAKAGQGKSGGFRTLVAKKRADAIIFIVGREKSSPGSDFTGEEEDGARIVAASYERATWVEIEQMVGNKALKEICHGKEKRS